MAVDAVAEGHERSEGRQRTRKDLTTTRSPSRLRDAPELDDRQVLALGVVADAQIDANTRPPSDEGAGSGTKRAPRPGGPRLEARCAARRPSSEVDLVGSSHREGFVRAVDIVPSLQVDTGASRSADAPKVICE